MRDTLSKKKASIFNMLLMGTYQLVTAVFGFVIPSLILNTYGANLHGYTSTISNILSYIALVNAGLAPAAIQALYAPLAKKDKHRISEVINAINRFYKISGFLYIIAITVVAFILPYVISNQLPSEIVVSLMLVIGAGNTLECFIYSKYRVLLQADQRLYIISLIDTFAYFVRVFLQAVLIRLKLSIVVVMLVPAVMIIIRMFALKVYCEKQYPGLDRKVRPDTTALKKRWSAMIHQLAGLVVYNTDVTLLTVFGSLVQVSIYSVYNLVFNHIYQLLTNIFSSSTLASFGRVINEDKREDLLHAFNLYEYGYYLIVTFVYGVTSTMILPFVSIYTIKYEDLPYVDVKLAFLFIVIGFINNMRIPSLTMINAAGHFKETQWRAILEAVINIVVSIMLIKPLGMYGLLIGTVCSFVYRTTDTIFYSHKYILISSYKKTFLRLMRSAGAVLISIGFYHVLIGKYVLYSWSEWLYYAVISSIITGLITLVTYFITEPSTFMSCLQIFFKHRKKYKAV